MYFKMEMQDYVAGPPGVPADCGCAGTTNTDNGMRYYTQNECNNIAGIDNPQGGNWYGNGECLIGHGRPGSYTATCAGLSNLKGKCVPGSAGPWGEVPQNMLNLTQEPFAPMASFQVYQSPQDFGADYNFADKRLGGLKMKWITLTGTPAWMLKYEQGVKRVLGLPFVRLRTDSSIRLKGSLKMFSFINMTFLLKFNFIPNQANTQEYIYFFGDLGRIGIRMKGVGNNQGQLHLYVEGGGDAPKTVPINLQIKTDTAYLLVLRSIRSNDSDIYSVNGISLDVQEFDVLKTDPTRLASTGKITFSNPRAFSNPDTNESRSLAIGGAAMDLTFVRLYDYDLDSDGIAREVKNDWQYLGE
jgi:hypothetical protein